MKMLKTRNNKLLIFGLSIFCILISMQSCGNENELAQKSVSVQNDFDLLTQISKKTWEEQLEFIKSCELNVLKRNDIQLLDYGSVNKISQNGLENIVAGFTDENNYIPYQKEGTDRINVIKFSELLIKKSPGVKINFSKQKEFFKELVGKSSGIVKLKWRVGNDEITTNCLVSDDKGIVFDNILTNIRVTKEEKVVKIDTISISNTKEQKSKQFKVAADNDFITYTIEKTWTRYHYSRTLNGYSGTATLHWGVVFISVEEHGSIINKEIVGTHDCGGFTVFEGGQSAAGVTAGQWDNQHAVSYLGYYFSVEGSLTLTFTSNSGYTFGTTIQYAGTEFNAESVYVNIWDL